MKKRLCIFTFIGITLFAFTEDIKSEYMSNTLYISNNNATFSTSPSFNITNTHLCRSDNHVGSFIGDFNGDGKDDILRWSDDYSYNRLYQSTGNGYFSVPTGFNIKTDYLCKSDNQYGSFIGDFNGDEKDDILRWSGNYTENTLYISDGNGAFSEPGTFNITNTHLCRSDNHVGSFIGDFNGDGKDDILRWSDDYSYNRLYQSTGNGYFSAPTGFNIKTDYLCKSDNQYGSFVGDFNGDGKDDILRWSGDYTENTLYISDGNGAFSEPGTFNITDTHLGRSDNQAGSFIGDFNGDGKDDILRWSDDYTENKLYMSDGNGAFSEPGTFNIINTHLCRSDNHVGSFVGDFNGDGKDDILRWAHDNNYNCLYFSFGNGYFTTPTAFNLSWSQLYRSDGTSGCYLMEINGDVSCDILRWSDNYAGVDVPELVEFDPGYTHTIVSNLTDEDYIQLHSDADEVHAMPVIDTISETEFTINGNWPNGTWFRGYVKASDDAYEIYHMEKAYGYAGTHPLIRDIYDYARAYLHLNRSGISELTEVSDIRVKSSVDYLVECQLFDGSYVWWQTRPSQTQGTIGENKADNPANVFPTSCGLRMLTEGYWYMFQQIKTHNGLGDIYTAIVNAADWLCNQNWDNINANVHGLGLWALGGSYKITHDKKYIYKMHEFIDWMYEHREPNEHLPARISEIDSISYNNQPLYYYHDTKIDYIGFILRGIIETYSTFDDADPYKTVARSLINLIINHIINHRVKIIEPRYSTGTGAELYILYCDTTGIVLPERTTKVDSATINAIAMLAYYSKYDDYYTTIDEENFFDLLNALGHGAKITIVGDDFAAKYNVHPFYRDYVQAITQNDDTLNFWVD